MGGGWKEKKGGREGWKENKGGGGGGIETKAWGGIKNDQKQNSKQNTYEKYGGTRRGPRLLWLLTLLARAVTRHDLSHQLVTVVVF